MRYLIFALMIALLPVRGWVGNAMAVDMAAQQVATLAGESSMPPDCPMHAQAAAPDDNANPQSDISVHCTDCNTCQLCLALASFTWTDLPTGSYSAHAGPLGSGTRFSSVDGGSRLKPPIS